MTSIRAIVLMTLMLSANGSLWWMSLASVEVVGIADASQIWGGACRQRCRDLCLAVTACNSNASPCTFTSTDPNSPCENGKICNGGAGATGSAWGCITTGNQSDICNPVGSSTNCGASQGCRCVGSGGPGGSDPCRCFVTPGYVSTPGQSGCT